MFVASFRKQRGKNNEFSRNAIWEAKKVFLHELNKNPPRKLLRGFSHLTFCP
jgi:hypothetical protein